jgi:hypothetical protein
LKRIKRTAYMNLSEHAAPADVDGNTLVLSFSQEGARNWFVNGNIADLLTQAVQQVTGARMHIHAVLNSEIPPAHQRTAPEQHTSASQTAFAARQAPQNQQQGSSADMAPATPSRPVGEPHAVQSAPSVEEPRSGVSKPEASPGPTQGGSVGFETKPATSSQPTQRQSAPVEEPPSGGVSKPAPQQSQPPQPVPEPPQQNPWISEAMLDDAARAERELYDGESLDDDDLDDSGADAAALLAENFGAEVIDEESDE